MNASDCSAVVPLIAPTLDLTRTSQLRSIWPVFDPFLTHGEVELTWNKDEAETIGCRFPMAEGTCEC